MKFDDILLIALALSLLIQMGYHWLVFARVAFYKAQTDTANKPPVSVVIVSRNDYHNLIKTLEPILNQDYPKFEVVLVNDQSDDETHYYLKELAKTFSHLKIVQIDQSLNFFRGKKFPLSIGIKSASYDTLLLTDSNCVVQTKDWITIMQQAFREKTQIVLGYGPYKRESGFLNKLIRFDAFFVAMNYLSFAILRMPYMGVGRNLAYSKALFYQKNGFIAHYKINSGHDDLFINQAATKTNTAVCVDPESFMYSESEKTLGLWLKRRNQQFSTSGLYKAKHRVVVTIYPLSLFLFYALSIAMVALNSWIIVVSILFGVRLLSFLLIQKSALQKLKEQKLLLISPILELLIYALQAIVMAFNIFNRKNKWN